VNGEQRIGPNDRNVHELDCLPDWISAYVDGWLLELWWRLDLNMTYDHMIARMDEDEVDEENERIAGERGAEKPGKKSTVKKSQRKNKEPWFEKPKGERFNGHTFNNCLNMRREHSVRKILGIRSWLHRRAEPTAKEIALLDKLTEEQLKYNTTLDVTDEGLKVVGFKENKAGKLRKFATGEYLPHDSFLEGAQPGEYIFSERLQGCLDKLRELRQKAQDKNAEHFRFLDQTDLPAGWKKHLEKAYKEEAEDDDEEDSEDQDDGEESDAEDDPTPKGRKRGRKSLSKGGASSSRRPTKKSKVHRSFNPVETSSPTADFTYTTPVQDQGGPGTTSQPEHFSPYDSWARYRMEQEARRNLVEYDGMPAEDTFEWYRDVFMPELRSAVQLRLEQGGLGFEEHNAFLRFLGELGGWVHGNVLH